MDEGNKNATRGWQMTQYLFYFPAPSGGISSFVNQELLYWAVVSREHIAAHVLILLLLLFYYYREVKETYLGEIVKHSYQILRFQ